MTDAKPAAEEPHSAKVDHTSQEISSDQIETSALQAVLAALRPLDQKARCRVLDYASSVFEIAPSTAGKSRAGENLPATGRGEGGSMSEGHPEADFDGFAKLFDAFQPVTNVERALIGGYWLQVCQGAASFDAQSINKELRELGHPVENITRAFDGLKGQTPSLAYQLKKAGKSQQARKLYKITEAGIKLVESRINGSGTSH